MLFGNTAAVDANQCGVSTEGAKILMLVDNLDRGSNERAARLPRGYRAATVKYWERRPADVPQPAFLTQNLHQPSGLISPSTSVQALGS